MGFYTTDAAVYGSMVEQVGHPEGAKLYLSSPYPHSQSPVRPKHQQMRLILISPNRVAVRSAGQLRSVAR